MCAGKTAKGCRYPTRQSVGLQEYRMRSFMAWQDGQGIRQMIRDIIKIDFYSQKSGSVLWIVDRC